MLAANEVMLCTIQAPILHDINLEYLTVQFDGSFLRENAFRQAAGPEVDHVWQSLGFDCERFPQRSSGPEVIRCMC